MRPRCQGWFPILWATLAEVRCIDYRMSVLT